MSEIHVSVVAFGDRKYLQLQWTDPLTGKKKTRSAKTTKQRDAERAAGQLEKQLRDGAYKDPSKTTWAEFRRRYEDEVLAGLAESTAHKAAWVFDTFERIVKAARLREVTAARVSGYAAELRRQGKAESSIKSSLAHLKAALRWAAKQGLLPACPTIEMPKRVRGGKVMKGRPITGEEFERMVDAVPEIVGDAEAPGWVFYLRGLWLSGLRLGESLDLTWDRQDRLRVDLTGRRPMLHIPAVLEKGHKDRLLPLAPDFAEVLLEVPQDQRTGHVFRPRRRNGSVSSADQAGRTLAAIGKKAGIEVHTDPKDPTKVKYASAHDLRRSFGERWAARVMPNILQELMRHETIETTMKYYVGQNAQRTADALWAAYEAATPHAESPADSSH